MHSLEPQTLVCPYCGEQIEVVVDTSAGHQEYVEDCSVCCRPIVISAEVEEGDVVGIAGRAENE